MSEIAVTIPDELHAELQAIAEDENRDPDQVIEAALREYVFRSRLSQNGREYRPAARAFWVPVLEEKDERGEPDVSVNHDEYLARIIDAKSTHQPQ